MKKNKWVLLLIAFVAFLVLVYFGIDNYFALHRHTGHLFSRKSNQIKIRKGKCDHEYKKIHQKTYGESAFCFLEGTFVMSF